MAFHLTRTGLRPPEPDELRGLQDDYAERSCVRLPGFLEPVLLGRIQERIARARWEPYLHDLDPPATDLLLVDPAIDGILATLVQDPRLFAAVRAVTGCDPIGCFNGRV